MILVEIILICEKKYLELCYSYAGNWIPVTNQTTDQPETSTPESRVLNISHSHHVNES